jgi:hypothetical protein
MRQSVFSRAVALSVALAFTGQVATPALDGLLYHSGGEHQPGAHWDPAGGCQSHGDRCDLGASLGGPRVIAPRLAPLASARGPVSRLTLQATEAFHPDPTTPLHHSRAPPVFEG